MAELTAEQDKKAKKIFFKAAGITGIGFGLFLLSLIGPFIYSGEEVAALQNMFFKYGVMTMIYTATMIGVFLFMRKLMVPTNIFMQWVYLPTLALMFAMEAFEILTK